MLPAPSPNRRHPLVEAQYGRLGTRLLLGAEEGVGEEAWRCQAWNDSEVEQAMCWWMHGGDGGFVSDTRRMRCQQEI